jgi:hypothetical protein
MTMLRISTIVLVVSCVGLAGCDEKLSSIAGPTPNLEPTFASIQRDIFQTADASGRPACINCHTNVGRNPAGGFNLVADAYNQVVAESSRKPGAIRVIPRDPANSYLLHKLKGSADIVGVRMPQNGPYLTDGQVRIIERWIEIGAPNN